jgi:hypothetical protein
MGYWGVDSAPQEKPPPWGVQVGSLPQPRGPAAVLVGASAWQAGPLQRGGRPPAGVLGQDDARARLVSRLPARAACGLGDRRVVRMAMGEPLRFLKVRPSPLPCFQKNIALV